MKRSMLRYATALALSAASWIGPALAADEFSSIHIRNFEVTPPSGATVDENTVVQAKLDYEIEKFKSDPDRYKVLAIFDTTTPNKVRAILLNVSDISSGQRGIRGQRGKMIIRCDLTKVLKKNKIAIPIQLRFFIAETIAETKEGDGTTTRREFKIIGETAKVTYKTTFKEDELSKPESNIPVPDSKAPIEVKTELKLEIIKIEIIPAIVQPGRKFRFIVTYRVHDPSDRSDRIPIHFTVKILKSGSVLFTKLVEVQAQNSGGKMSKIQTFTATKDPGRYDMEAVLQYKDKTVRKRTPLEIR